jgi:hypothetical protein
MDQPKLFSDQWVVFQVVSNQSNKMPMTIAKENEGD